LIFVVVPLLVVTIVLFGFGFLNPWVFIAAGATALLAMVSVFAHRGNNTHV